MIVPEQICVVARGVSGLEGEVLREKRNPGPMHRVDVSQRGGRVLIWRGGVDRGPEKIENEFQLHNVRVRVSCRHTTR